MKQEINVKFNMNSSYNEKWDRYDKKKQSGASAAL